RRDPGPSADTPYETKAPALPKNLGEAVSALRRSDVFRKGLGDAFVDYFAHIKEAEFARFTAETGGEADGTAWEHNEYFDLFWRPSSCPAIAVRRTASYAAYCIDAIT